MISIVINEGKPLSYAEDQKQENLSTRLTNAMRILGVSQSELARGIGVKPQAIQYLCNNNATRSKLAFEIADVLGISLDWLVAGRGKMIESIPSETTVKVPLLDWSDIGSWLKDSNNNNMKLSGYISAQMPSNEKYYALKMLDSSMTPRFEIGTTLIIDPQAVPEENDFVIVETEFSTTPIIRQLIKKQGKLLLYPTNTDLYKEVDLSEQHKIFGVLRQAIYEFSRR